MISVMILCCQNHILLIFQYLENIRQSVHENLRNLLHAPSVQMQDVPQDLLSLDHEEETDPDIRNNQEEVDNRSVSLVWALQSEMTFSLFLAYFFPLRIRWMVKKTHKPKLLN